MRKAIFSITVVAALLMGSATAFADGPNYQQPGDGNAGDRTTSSGQSASMSPSSTTHHSSVVIRNMKFTPTDLTVWQGATVTWVNQDTIAHTVTSDDTTSNVKFDSGTLQPGQSFSYTFSQINTYAYHCSIHPQMTGSVNVISQPQQPTPTNPSQPSRSFSSPSVSAQANSSATVNNYSGSSYGCTSQRTGPTTTYRHTTPDYSQPMTSTYRTTKASVSAPTPAPVTTEQALPNTGPAGTIAIAAAATSIGTGGYYLYLLKRKKF